MRVAVLCWFIIMTVTVLSAVAAEREAPMPADMIFIEGGCFQMGDLWGRGDEDELPVHIVCLDEFYLGRYEITVGEFRNFADTTGYKTDAEKSKGCVVLKNGKWRRDPKASWRNPGYAQTEQSPAVCVNYDDAIAYAQWLSKKEGRKYRLPTEAEWEYAARARGKERLYAWGNDPMPDANICDETAAKLNPLWAVWGGYSDGYIYSAPVGKFAPTPQGLFDMTGNVWEWTMDYYDPGYYTKSPRHNPQGPKDGVKRCLRGGSWFSKPRCVRTTKRNGAPPSMSAINVGFRLAHP